MNLDPEKLFHHGIVVQDIESAIGTMSKEAGLRFSPPWPSTQKLRTADGVIEVEFVLSYSAEGPIHAELVQHIPGTLWSTERAGTLHHLGYWTDDLAADGARLEEAGLAFAFKNLPEPGQAPTYAYYRSALGIYIELVHTSMRPIIEQLWETTLKSARSGDTT